MNAHLKVGRADRPSGLSWQLLNNRLHSPSWPTPVVRAWTDSQDTNRISVAETAWSNFVPLLDLLSATIDADASQTGGLLLPLSKADFLSIRFPHSQLVDQIF